MNGVINERHIDLLVHMLGAGPHINRRIRGFRNHFCAALGSPDHSAMLEMQAAGLVYAGAVINDGKSQYFRATPAGCEAAGLSKAATKRALQP